VKRRVVVGEYLLTVARDESNWGWRLNNEFGSYSSIEDAEELINPGVEALRNHLTNMWVAGLGGEDEDEDEWQQPAVLSDESSDSEEEEQYGYNSLGQEE